MKRRLQKSSNAGRKLPRRLPSSPGAEEFLQVRAVRSFREAVLEAAERELALFPL